MELSLYEVLQVSPNAEPDVIEATYQQLVTRYQKLAVNDIVAANHLQTIRQAYQTLRDPERRAAYDKQLGPTPIVKPSRSAPAPGSGAPIRRRTPVKREPRMMPRGFVSIPYRRTNRSWPIWLAGIVGLGLILLGGTICFGGVTIAGLGSLGVFQDLGKLTSGLTAPITSALRISTPGRAGTPTPPAPLPTLVTTSDPQVAFVKDLVTALGTEGENFEPVDVTETFAPDATLHAVVMLQDAPPDTSFRAVWYFEDVGQAALFNSKLGEYGLTSEGTRNLDFTLKPKTAWSVGTYRVEVYANGILARSIRFTVKPAEVINRSGTVVAGTSYIKATNLAREVTDQVFDPINPTTLFRPDDVVIHLVVTIENAPATTSFKVAWRYGGQVIDSTSLTTGGTRNLNFTLTGGSKPWPAGDYNADIYVDGRLERTVYFTIQ